LPAGTYTFTVYEFEGFSKSTAPVVLTAPDILDMSLTVYENTITVESSGGVGNHQYSLDDINYQTSPVFEDLLNGDYTVWTKDDNACTTSDVATISINTLIAVSVVEQGVSCNGDTDGQISVLVNGGEGPYTYSLDDITYQNENVFYDLAPGSYSFFVKDSDGHKQKTNPIILLDPNPLVLNASVSGNNLIAVASGGTGNLLYSIDNQNWQSEFNFSDLENGTYTVWVRDNNDCTVSETVSISLTTSVNNLLNPSAFEIYPNPNQGIFKLDIKEELGENINIRIFDNQGKLIEQQVLKNSLSNISQTINLAHLSNGVYQIMLSDGERIGTKRLLIFR